MNNRDNRFKKNLHGGGRTIVVFMFLTASMYGYMFYRLSLMFVTANRDAFIFAALLVVFSIPLFYCVFAQPFFTRFCVDHDGIHTKCLFLPKKLYAWEDIRLYGVSQYDNTYSRYVFFSKDEIEADVMTKEEFSIINKRRTVISLCDEYWQDMKTYMPQDMVNNIEKALLVDERKKFKR